MPFPNPETQFKPGNTGNPKGHSAGRRVTAALVRLIEEKGADNPLALTWLAMALGDTAALKGRKPNFAFFKELLDRTEGKVPEVVVTGADPDAPPRLVPPDADDRKSKAKANAKRRRKPKPVAGGPGGDGGGPPGPGDPGGGNAP